MQSYVPELVHGSDNRYVGITRPKFTKYPTNSLISIADNVDKTVMCTCNDIYLDFLTFKLQTSQTIKNYKVVRTYNH